MELKNEREIVFRRRFSANPLQVYAAHLDPEVIPQWMTGPPGWRMVKCECDPRLKGSFRFEWSNDSGEGFHTTGEFLELDRGKKIRHIEQMFLPDPTPKNEVETTFSRDGEGTLMILRMQVPDSETRAAMLASGMEAGMEQSYQRLDELRLESMNGGASA